MIQHVNPYGYQHSYPNLQLVSNDNSVIDFGSTFVLHSPAKWINELAHFPTVHKLVTSTLPPPHPDRCILDNRKHTK